MIIETSRLGSIEIDGSKIIDFKDGLPGFEDLRKFILLSPEELNPFHLLQSTEDGNIGLIVADPFLLKEDYAPLIDDAILENLKIEEDKQATLLSIISIPQDYKKMTANLMAPIIINGEKLLGKQVILNKGNYSLRHPVFQVQDGEGD